MSYQILFGIKFLIGLILSGLFFWLGVRAYTCKFYLINVPNGPYAHAELNIDGAIH